MRSRPAKGGLPPLAGVLAAALAVAVTELVAGMLPGGQSVFAAVGDRVIASTPGPIVALAIDVLGGANRAFLLAAMAAGMLVAAAVIGRAAAQRRWVGVAGLGAFAAAGAAAGVAEPQLPAVTAMLAPAAGWAAGSLVLATLLRRATAGRISDGPARQDEAGGGDQAPDRPPASSRRAFLSVAGATAGVAVASAVGGRALQLREAGAAARRAVVLPEPADPLPAPSAAARLDVDGLSPLLTPNDDFYRIDAALTVPRIDPHGHTVAVTGMVEDPYVLGYEELLALAETEADVTLSCVSNEVGGDLVGNARWLGVPLADVLRRAGVQDDATQVIGRSVDGWTGGFPVEAAFDGRDALVVVGMNGEPLPAEHGFPVRLVVAGLYGYVSDTKWLAEIELSTFEAYDAYWIERGWAEEGPIKTQSRIDVPAERAQVAAGTVPVAGVAWAGERGIAAVEVSIDDGDWQQAELPEELSQSSWRQWVYRWQAPPGEHTVRVRATDGDGEVQTAQETGPMPDGATGHHAVAVDVVEGA